MYSYGLKARKHHCAPAPICLLYANNRGQIVPIAIQMRQGLREEDQREPNPIFLPSDSVHSRLEVGQNILPSCPFTGEQKLMVATIITKTH